MKVLVLGGGGREHALVRKLKQSRRVEEIWCAPGNGGISADATCIPINIADNTALVSLAERIGPDLTVVGPEVPLVNGATDLFRQRDWPIIGPSQPAAQLEGSKVFTKQFLQRHRIPTAAMLGIYESAECAYAALRDEAAWPLVIKADGLCAGKGVLVAENQSAAEAFVRGSLEQNELGSGGKRLMFEEALEGKELSFIILTDGHRYAPLVPTRDHKRVFDGNQGPNTGGMGAYSADELLPDQLLRTITADIVEPTLRGLAADGIPYQGFLYIGLMLTKSGPKVLEFNCRLGDPETQAITTRMDFDLAEVLQDVASGRLDPAELQWKQGASVCVVLASGGYPGKFETGKKITGLAEAGSIPDVEVFHAGTKREGDSLVTSGGRVLGVTATAASLDAAAAKAYEAVSKIHFDGMHYRKDIAAHGSRTHAAGD
jgi:phosphoribosylamine--glycine ligase